MTIKRGTPSIQRRHAGNYISQQADARLSEVVRPFQQKGLNAIAVDAFDIRYYYQSRSTTLCTCKQTQLLPEHSVTSSNIPPTLMRKDGIMEETLRIDFVRPLFGTANENATTDDDTELDDFDLDEEQGPAQGPVVESLFSSSVDCGICYKTGFFPGYSCYGYEREVCTTHNAVKSYGYNIDLTSSPHAFDKLDPVDGFVDFEVVVPRYVKNILFSVRDNTLVIPDVLFNTDNTPLTLGNVLSMRGSVLTFRVRANKFTHVVMEFDLGTDKLKAQLAQQQKTVDWSLFDTLGTISMVLPMTIANVTASDIIHVPSRNMSFKITDVNYLRTSKDKNLNWEITTRVVQPQEALKYIQKAYRLP